jgi:hypothetical protein
MGFTSMFAKTKGWRSALNPVFYESIMVVKKKKKTLKIAFKLLPNSQFNPKTYIKQLDF